MTTQATHTPGPWAANDDGLVLGNLDNYEGEAPLVCSCGESDDFNMEPSLQLANARLIAAAPDLLEALQGMAMLLSDVLSGAQSSEVQTRQVLNYAADLARAAIAKAEGRAGQ